MSATPPFVTWERLGENFCVILWTHFHPSDMGTWALRINLINSSHKKGQVLDDWLKSMIMNMYMGGDVLKVGMSYLSSQSLPFSSHDQTNSDCCTMITQNSDTHQSYFYFLCFALQYINLCSLFVLHFQSFITWVLTCKSDFSSFSCLQNKHLSTISINTALWTSSSNTVLTTLASPASFFNLFFHSYMEYLK